MDNTRPAINDAHMFFIVMEPVVFALGIAGNIITILVLMKHKKYSTTVFLILLAFADLSATIVVFPNYFFIYLFNFHIQKVSNFSCKMHYFLSLVSGRTSNSSLVALTIERMLCTVRPHSFNRICNRRIATVICVTIFAVIFLFHLHLFYGITLQEKITSVVKLSSNESAWLCNSTLSPTMLATDADQAPLTKDNIAHINQANVSRELANLCETITYETTQSCDWEYDKRYANFYTNVFEKISVAVFYFLTNSIFLIGFLVIAIKLRQARNKCQNLSEKKTFARSQSVRITITLLVVNVSFLILTTPFVTFFTGRHIWVDKEKGMTYVQSMLWSIFLLMYSTNYAANFLLYFCTGAKFRQQTREFFLPCRRSRKIKPASTTLATSTERTTLSNARS